MSVPACLHENRRRNDFQDLMRSWKELAPYNAAHILEVSGAADIPRWEEAFGRALKQIDSNAGALRVETASSRLDETVTRELNRRFSDGELPFRAVIIQTEPESHLLIGIYDHCFADSPSIRLLLRHVFHAYRGGTSDLPPIRVAESVRSPRSRVSTNFKTLANAWRAYRDHRRACRIDLHDPQDFQTGFFSRQFAPGVIHGVRAMARQHNAKVNDAFVAVAAQVLGDYTARKRAASRKRLFHPRRDRVGIASAVDLRECDADAPVFGFAVGYYSVVLERPEQIALPELVCIVAKETALKKANKNAAGFSLTLKCARWFWKLNSSPHARAQLFLKGLPLLAGVSNVNLSGSWIEDASAVTEGARLLDYLRVSPVGPIMPFVFTLTTIGDRLSLCVSFRTTAFSRPSAQQLADAFVAKLLSFTPSPSATKGRSLHARPGASHG